MKRNFPAVLILLLALVACGGRTVDLGGSEDVAGAQTAGSCGTTGPLDPGTGGFSGLPDWCSADGPQTSFSTTKDVATAIVGSWRVCSGDFLTALSPDTNAVGIELTAAGQFFFLNAEPDTYALARTTEAREQGTFEALDASATLGPGTYQLRLTSAVGGVQIAQVVAYDSPSKLRFFSPSATDFVHALTWSSRAGVCGTPFGPRHLFGDERDIASRVTGRWIWCGGFPVLGNTFDSTRANPSVTRPPSLIGLATIGIELADDGNWYLLAQDPNGSLVRTTGPDETGAFEIHSDGTVRLLNGPIGSGAWFDVSVSVDSCGRGLQIGTSGTNALEDMRRVP